MEKTFLQTTSTKRRGYLSQGKLTKDIRAILVLGVFWIVLQFLASLIVVIGRLLDCRVTAKGNVGFSAWIFTEKDMNTETMWTLLVLMLAGFLAFDLVYVAVVVNYCAQCQLLISLIRGMNERIEEKSVPLQQAIREYHNAGKFIDSFNRQLAIAVSLMEVNIIVHAFGSFLALYDLESSYTSETTGALFLVSAVMYCGLWSAAGLFAFAQVSHVR
jgi:hypothetical protein